MKKRKKPFVKSMKSCSWRKRNFKKTLINDKNSLFEGKAFVSFENQHRFLFYLFLTIFIIFRCQFIYKEVRKNHLNQDIKCLLKMSQIQRNLQNVVLRTRQCIPDNDWRSRWTKWCHVGESWWNFLESAEVQMCKFYLDWCLFGIELFRNLQT